METDHDEPPLPISTIEPHWNSQREDKEVLSDRNYDRNHPQGCPGRYSLHYPNKCPPIRQEFGLFVQMMQELGRKDWFSRGSDMTTRLRNAIFECVSARARIGMNTDSTLSPPSAAPHPLGIRP
jgi:hypothetical protein